MKNNTVIFLLLVLSVALYTVAVIDLCLGDVLSGIVDVLMATFCSLMVYTLYRVGQLGRMACNTRNALIGIVEQLTKGVPATLTVKDGKGTLILGDKEDEDEEASKAE